ncbi:hypothetical protein PHMEG_00010997 [Phytophthora megakarya]|uniref:Uncharacterized protein n=1 Tax=Phytophthora megakarya TaxID=4795 RepID=A0A225WDQ4_9STRA|nr:hypothetical protein PHMEG_00010997 [Phytophthora megakarya]
MDLAEYLRQSMPVTHPLLATAIFRDQQVMNSLRCKLDPNNSSPMVPTGIPPYVDLYQQQRETQQVIDCRPDVLLSGFSGLLDEKGVGAGAMRKKELQAKIRDLLNEAGLYHTNRVQHKLPSESNHSTIIYWGRDDKFHRLPEDFEFPDVNVLGVWHVLWFGNGTMGYPPFKGLNHQRKRYSEWTNVIKHLCDAVKSTTGRDLQLPKSQLEADVLFRTAIANVPMMIPTSERNIT